MGYYTRHTLEIIEGDHEVIEEFRNECEYAEMALNEDGDSEESCKWYDHDKDLKEFSKKHPDTLFKLSGEGEEAGDMWCEYYRNGAMQRCKAIITYEGYDPTKLK